MEIATDRQFGLMVRLYRDSEKMTQSELARKMCETIPALATQQKRISAIENGSEAKRLEIVALSEIFQLHTDELCSAKLPVAYL